MKTVLFCMIVALNVFLLPQYFKSDQYKNYCGRLKGYSGCMNCGGTWNWKKNHTIQYSEQSGMYPLCEDCFKFLPMSEIKKNIQKLVNEWGSKKQDKESIINAAVKQACIDKSKEGMKDYDMWICSECLDGPVMVEITNI